MNCLRCGKPIASDWTYCPACEDALDELGFDASFPDRVLEALEAPVIPQKGGKDSWA